jgi:signal transduction histidine kinase
LKEGIVETNDAYKTIKEQNLKVLESDRIKNEFLANISHELRTPLNAIIGFSEVLSAKLFGELNEKQTDYVKDIHVSGIHLLGMINEILDISKIEAHAMTLNPGRFMISRAIDEVVNVVKPLADKKHICIEKKNPQDCEVFADFQKISQILYNLLSNAIKFSDKSDKIFVAVEFTPNSFLIKIEDKGIGIDEKYHGKIFAKFVQLQSSYTKNESSTGLGLTITKQLVEMHNGTISVKSEVGKGTTFIVEIPLVVGEND